jgi:hypothetical protein
MPARVGILLEQTRQEERRSTLTKAVSLIPSPEMNELVELGS